MKQGNSKHSLSNRIRVIRYAILIIFTILIVSISIDLSLAWVFVSNLTHPKCVDPQPLQGINRPEEIWVSTEDGYTIRIWHYPSQNGATVISLGGLTGSLGNQIPPVESLIRAGYGVVQVEGRRCALPPAVVTLGGDELYDAEAALVFLSTVDGATVEKIGTIGFSMGGATAIRLASRNPQIIGVVRDGGFADLGEMLSPPDNASIQQKIFQNTVYFLFRLRTKIDPTTVSPRQDISLISPRPILLIYGEAESDYGKIQFEAARNPKELWIVPGGTHGTNHVVAPKEYKKRVLDFFDQALLK